ncbi:MAG TPA: hypothetical protein VF647_21745 [Longimicrobium sp.]|jgi:hypothetical protein
MATVRLLDDVVKSTLAALKLEPLTATTAEAGKPIGIRVIGLPESGVLTRDLPVPLNFPLTGVLTNVRLGATLTDVKLTGGLTQTLDARVVSKEMLFANTLLEGAGVENPQNAGAPELPFINLPALPPQGPSGPNFNLINLGLVPRSAIEGVPGALSQADGSLTSTIDHALTGDLAGPITGTIVTTIDTVVNLPVDVPFKVSVSWRVCADRAGKEPLSSSEYRIDGPLDQPSVDIVLRPDTFDWLKEEDGSIPPPAEGAKRYLFADVTISASGVSHTASVGPVELATLSLGIPRMLAMFADYNFTGPALVMVPQGSPLGELSQFLKRLEPLQAVLQALRSFPQFGPLALGFGSILSGTLTNPHIAFRETEGIAKMNDIVLIQNDRFTNDMEAEDEIRSLLLLGNTGATVQCFNAPEFKGDEGWFQLGVKEGYVAIVRNLHRKHPVTEPEQWFMDVKKEPDGAFNAHTFGQALSSVRFASPDA